MNGLSNAIKRSAASSDDDDLPLAVKVSSSAKRSKHDDSNHHEQSRSSVEPPPKKIKKEKKAKHEKVSQTPASSKKPASNGKVKDEPTSASNSPTKSQKREKKEKDAEEPVWEWWKEEKLADGTKWKSLHHIGPYFAPPYEPLPAHVRFYYDGKQMRLSPGAEEVATFYAKMLDHEYTTKDIFNKNFFTDWVKYMTPEERHTIRDIKKCDFKEMHTFFVAESEARKNCTKEEKEKRKKENAEIQKVYGYCTLDGYKQKIANFRIEPPGLFRGRGNHPKMGMVKKRIQPEDIIINCSRDSVVPKAPEGHKWKEVRHDNQVSWLACWVENIQGNFKYVMLNASSKLKGEKDWKKYETARKLHKYVDKIRDGYRSDFKHKEMRIRQRAVALYFIDKLALRAGNEKDEDEADTVGCCSLRIEHVKLHDEQNGNKHVVEFDFLGKDSIRYQNSVPVAKRVFKNLKLFMKNKQPGDDLFDRLNTTILNQYLRDLMDGLTAKVFRTYNASKTLEEQLELLTQSEMDVPNKILAYNRANRAVAILCNHQRAVPKTFQKSMENLQAKIKAKQDQIKAAKKEFKELKDQYSKDKDPKKRQLCEKKKKQVATLKQQLQRLDVQATDKDENKEIALGTSKLNYLDPRITVAWCKKWAVPIEKVYNKTQREKFQWAIDMATKDFVFRDVTSDVASNKMAVKREADSDEDEEADPDAEDDDAGSQ